MKKFLTTTFLILGIVLISGCSLNEQKPVDNSAMTEQITALQQKISGFSSQMETLKSENEQLKLENERIKKDIFSVNSGNVKLIEEEKSLKEDSEKYKSRTSLTINQESKKAVINGTLGFPSNSIPIMKVCAVNAVSKEETCVNNSKDSYSIIVDPGSYLVYTKEEDSGMKAYYTKCDTYDNKFIPECNPNAGDATGWGHICYEDNTCKSAFTPLKIIVNANDNISLKRIEQGWYIPCSYDIETCNSANFDVWTDYLPYKEINTQESNQISKEEIIKNKAIDILIFFKNKDFQKILPFLHDDFGITFHHQGSPEGVKISKSEMNGILTSNKVISWRIAGIGNIVDTTFREYYERFYSYDFFNAKNTEVYYIGKQELTYQQGQYFVDKNGKLIYNRELYFDVMIAHYFLSGQEIMGYEFEPVEVEQEWKSLKLVFNNIDNEWYLIGVIQDEHTP